MYVKNVFAFFVIILTQCAAAEVLYVDSQNGNDFHPGTKDKPLQSIAKAAAIVNDSNDPGPTKIKITPGAYCVTEMVVFENPRQYTKDKRFVIESTVLPNDPNWTPALMPVMLSTVNGEGPDTEKHAIALKIEVNHATVRGIKFLGNPRPRTWGYSIFRAGKELEDLVVAQCMFVGDEQALPYNCPICANGQSLVVDHCVFYKCDIPAIFWDAEGGISKGNAMRYCIVDGADIAAVWTCQTAEDFEFHHNIVTRGQYFWMRAPNNRKKYRINDCMVTDNKYNSGYGTAAKIYGQTGPEINFYENNVTKEGTVQLEKAIVTADALSVVRPRGYLHVVPEALGSDLGAGLFTKSVRGKKIKEQGYRKETHVYKEVDGHEILADVYLPAERGIRPAFIYLHGGGFIFGNRTGCRKPLRDKLLEAGYVVISIDYRLAPETKLEEIVKDVKDACKWVREKGPELFNINSKRVAVGGGSAGGVLALIAGYAVEPRPQALVVVSTPAGEAKDAKLWKGDRSVIKKETPYDVVSDKIVSDGGYSERMELWRWLAENRLSLSEVLGFDPESDIERFKKLIPLENITNDYPTTLIVHARIDRFVPFSQAEKIANVLRAKEIEHEVFVVPDGHNSEIIRNYPDAVAKIVSFLDRYLKKP